MNCKQLEAQQIDPENRLLWRMNERRLSFEEMRDSLLSATGQLDRTVGGRAGDLFSPQFARRTLYGSIDRQFLPSTLRIFDFANPDLHIPLRSDTTVPQQALFFLNHPLMIGYAQALAAQTAAAGSDEAARSADVPLGLSATLPRPEQVHSALELVQLAVAGRSRRRHSADRPRLAIRLWRIRRKVSASRQLREAAALHRLGLARRIGLSRRQARLGATHRHRRPSGQRPGPCCDPPLDRATRYARPRAIDVDPRTQAGRRRPRRSWSAAERGCSRRPPSITVRRN